MPFEIPDAVDTVAVLVRTSSSNTSIDTAQSNIHTGTSPELPRCQNELPISSGGPVPPTAAARDPRLVALSCAESAPSEQVVIILHGSTIIGLRVHYSHQTLLKLQTVGCLVTFGPVDFFHNAQAFTQDIQVQMNKLSKACSTGAAVNMSRIWSHLSVPSVFVVTDGTQRACAIRFSMAPLPEPGSKMNALARCPPIGLVDGGEKVATGRVHPCARLNHCRRTSVRGRPPSPYRRLGLLCTFLESHGSNSRDLGSAEGFQVPHERCPIQDLSEGGYTGEQVVHLDVVLPRPRKTSHKIQSDPSNLARQEALVKDESVGITIIHFVDALDPESRPRACVCSGPSAMSTST